MDSRRSNVLVHHGAFLDHDFGMEVAFLHGSTADRKEVEETSVFGGKRCVVVRGSVSGLAHDKNARRG